MFLLPSIVVGVALAAALGGDLRRVAMAPLRLAWAAPLALAIQVVLFSGHISPGAHARDAVHLASYGILIAFVIANRKTRGLLPVAAGLLLNVAAIVANGGVMPVAARAAAAAGVTQLAGSNVSVHATHLRALGDVFALPRGLPFANVFSIGDVLIGVGMIGFIVTVALGAAETRTVRVRRLAAPFATRSFALLATGRFVTQLGDWLTLTAVVGWIFQSTHSTSDVTAVLLVRMVPAIVGGASAAVVVDRLPKRFVLVGVELTRCVLLGGALAAVVSGRRVELLVALGLSGLVAPLSGAVVPAVVPRLLGDDLYEGGNAALGIADNGAAAVGAACGGAIVALLGIRPALVVDISTFAVAALLYTRVRVPADALERAARAASRLYGLRYLLRSRRLLTLVVAFGAATLATGLVNATLPRLLGVRTSVGAGGYGYGIAAITLGLALGELAVGTLRLGRGSSRWIGGGLMVMAGLLALLAFERDAPTVFLVLAALGLVDGTTDIVFETVVQREAERHVLGSLFGFAAAFVRTTMIFSFALAPLLNRLASPDRVVLLTGAFLLLVGLAATLAIGRSDREAAPAAQSELALAPLPR